MSNIGYDKFLDAEIRQHVNQPEIDDDELYEYWRESHSGADIEPDWDEVYEFWRDNN